MVALTVLCKIYLFRCRFDDFTCAVPLSAGVLTTTSTDVAVSLFPTYNQTTVNSSITF